MADLYIKSIKWFLYFGIIAFIFAIVWICILNNISKKQGNYHGTAKIATIRQIKKMGMLKQDQGVVCGQLLEAKVDANKEQEGNIKMKLKKAGRLICHPGKINTLLLAPTGSGKGVSVLMPSLCWFINGSVIVLDPKGESYDATSRWRSTFSRVLKFSPCTWDTLRFNPVNEIRDGIEFAFRDSDLIADIIFAPPKVGGSTENSEYFTNSAKTIVTAALLHIRFSDYHNKSLGGLRDFLSGGNQDEIEKLLAGKGEANPDLGKSQAVAMAHTKHYFIITQHMFDSNKEKYQKLNLNVGDRYYDPELDEMISKGAADIMQTNAKEKASVWKTIASKIRLFDDPTVRYATGASDFEIMDFINSNDPISLYLVIPYSDIERLAPVNKIIITLILKRLSEGMTRYGKQKLKNNILIILDEFPILGSFPVIAEEMGVLRGYGVFFIIVCQALNQLVDRYGQNHPFLDHCTVQIIFAPGKIEDAEVYSRSIGNETVHQQKISRSGKLKINDSNLNYSDQDMGRALFDAADIKRLDPDKCIIMVHGEQPILAEKVVYYMDFRFKNRISDTGLEMNELYQEVRGLPSRIKILKEIENNKIAMEHLKEVENSSNFENSTEIFEDEEIDILLDDIEFVQKRKFDIEPHQQDSNEDKYSFELKESQNVEIQPEDNNIFSISIKPENTKENIFNLNDDDSDDIDGFGEGDFD